MKSPYDTYNPRLREQVTQSYQSSIANGEGLPEGFVPQPNAVEAVSSQKGLLGRGLDAFKGLAQTAVERLMDTSNSSLAEDTHSR